MKKLTSIANFFNKLSLPPEVGSQAIFIQHNNKPGKNKTQAEDVFDFLKFIKSWHLVVGQKFAEHTIPLKHQFKELTILSNHATISSELKFLENHLIEKITKLYPRLESKITTIRFINDTTHFAQLKKKLIYQENLPLDNHLHDYSPEKKRLTKIAEKMFEDIDDIEVKEKFISLYIQNHQSSK